MRGSIVELVKSRVVNDEEIGVRPWMESFLPKNGTH
jgi:antirestriction protein ArdC